MRRMRRAKILATLGPASHEEKMIEELAKAGADVFRINMSHASHEVLHQTVARIRAVEKRLNHPLGILVDLQGPKLRVGRFDGGSVLLATGDSFVFDRMPEMGDLMRVQLPHPLPGRSAAPLLLHLRGGRHRRRRLGRLGLHVHA